MTSAQLTRWVVKPAVFAACLLPAALLVARGATGDLGANPISEITIQTGTWTLRLLLITLAVTPIRRFSGWNDAIRLRRMLGLFAFFYATLHFSTYFVLDHFFDLAQVVQDVGRRPFISAGSLAFVLLVPLAATSTAGMIRRLGGRRWRQLHRLVYASALAGVVHYLWLVKADIREPIAYAVVLAVLLGVRLPSTLKAFPLQNSPIQRPAAPFNTETLPPARHLRL